MLEKKKKFKSQRKGVRGPKQTQEKKFGPTTQWVIKCTVTPQNYHNTPKLKESKTKPNDFQYKLN